MTTYFASPERSTPLQLSWQISRVRQDPVITGLLHTIGGLLAILNEHRQIVALNDSFLDLLGITDPEEAFGLRPGEAVRCVYACDEPAGCGTTKYCTTCGAAIAIVASQSEHRPVERICTLSARREGKDIDIILLVRAVPMEIEDRTYILLFLQDITQQHQRAAIERTFFHDINNMLTMLLGASELLVAENPSELATIVHNASLRLYREIAIQRSLSSNDSFTYQPVRQRVSTQQIMAELRSFFLNHPLTRDRTIMFQSEFPEVSFVTDFSLVSRILCNMVLNALEATEAQGSVYVTIEQIQGERITFSVWNACEIPPEITGRIFRRNFTTKEQAGHGIGTYSMKLFGEEILGGSVSFTTSHQEGTTFIFSLPL